MEGHEKVETGVISRERSIPLKRKSEDEESSQSMPTGIHMGQPCTEEHTSVPIGTKCLSPVRSLGQKTSLDCGSCNSPTLLEDEKNRKQPSTPLWNATAYTHDPLEILTSEFASEASQCIEDVFDFGLAVHSIHSVGGSHSEGTGFAVTTNHPALSDSQHGSCPVQCFPASHGGGNHLTSENDPFFRPRKIAHLLSSECKTLCMNQCCQGFSTCVNYSCNNPGGMFINHAQNCTTAFGNFPECKSYVSATGSPSSLEIKSKSFSPSEIREHIRCVAEKVSKMEERTCMTSTETLEAGNNVLSQVDNLDSGVQFIQKLLACAEAVACRDKRQAESLLTQVQLLASPYGNSLQRVAACFVEGLKARLDYLSASLPSLASVRKDTLDMQRQEGFHLMYEACPYVSFGHFAANSVILEAFEGEEAVHVVDLGMEIGLQWPSLMQRLANRASGPPRVLRITGVGLSPAKMKEIGQQLERVAGNLKLGFEFHVVVQPLENLERSMLEVREGEALAVNSVLQLHKVVKESRGSLNAVLQSIHLFSPKVLTLVEQDASHNGPFFLGRFSEALHYYSAIFDSLDAIMPRYSTQRVKIEQFHFAREIKNIISCEGPSRVERHERVDQWRRRMSRAGFHPSPLNLLAEARDWLSSNYNCDHGYTLAEEKGCLVLGWRGKSIIAASSWRC